MSPADAVAQYQRVSAAMTAANLQRF